MLDKTSPSESEKTCQNQVFLLSVYEAGHAITARALGLRILSVRMLPRPPVLVSDKAIGTNDWTGLIETLEMRIIELFGGQIAEELQCGTNTCCAGDIVRIDELCRLVSGLSGDEDYESIMFRLEDEAQKIFKNADVRAAVSPMAQFFYLKSTTGNGEIAGPEIETELNKYLSMPSEKSWLKRTFGSS